MFFYPVINQFNILPQFSPKEELGKFHSKIAQTFSPLRARALSENLIEVVERIIRVVIAPFIYLVLVALSCIEWLLQQVSNLSFQKLAGYADSWDEEDVSAGESQVGTARKDKEGKIIDLSSDEEDSSISDLSSDEEEDSSISDLSSDEEEDSSVEESEVGMTKREEIVDLSLDCIESLKEKLTPENKLLNENDSIQIPHFDTMRLLKKNRLDNVEEELKRLRDQQTLTPDLEKIIDTALAKVQSYSFDVFNDKKPAKVLLGRTLEIKNLYQDTHYIFTHSQAAKYFTPVCLIKELVKLFFPKRNVHFSTFLRTPQQRTSEIKDFKAILADAEQGSIINDHVGEIRMCLLSADAYLFNAESGESALNFLCRNYSVLDNKKGAFENLFQLIFSNFITKRIPDYQFVDLTNRMVKIAESVHSVSGNLFVICVPKKMVEDLDKTIVYRAHPYGKPCDCHPEDKDIEILKQLQQHSLNTDNLCNGSTIPQFRLLAAALTPENGVYSFGLTSFSRAGKKYIKEQIAKVAADAYSIVQNFSG